MTIDTPRMIIIGVFALCAILILVWASWPPKPSKQQLFAQRPYATFVNDWCRHDFYRDISLAQVTAHWGENAFDYIFYVEDSAVDYTIAIIQVFNWVAPVHFKTVLRLTDGSDIQVDWKPVKGKLLGEATGLLMIPKSIVGGKTEVLS